MQPLPTPLDTRSQRPWSQVAAFGLCALVGFGAGFLNGLLGAAGGILLVLVLPYVRPPARLMPSAPDVPLRVGLAQRDLLASACAVMLPVSALSFVLYLVSGMGAPLALSAAIILPSVAGGILGARLLGRIPAKWLRCLFALLVILSGVRMVFG